jgi:hypothetical protein
MATLNKRIATAAPRTYEGAVAKRINPLQQLRRLVMCCLLWEDSFYIDGQSHAQVLAEAIKNNKPQDVANVAVEAREKFKLRHVPLFLARELARGSKEARLLVADTLERIIQRPDELTEFLAIYWKDGRQPLSAQVKKGLARAFYKFNRYSLAKYNRDGAVKLRDVMFLTHPDPRKEKRTPGWGPEVGDTAPCIETYKMLAENTLTSPDTWEVALSAGADKAATFTRLIQEKKLGALAMLRNLRNMIQSGVEERVIVDGLQSMNTERVLPFRFISAAKYAPKFEPYLEEAMFKCVADAPKLKGKTVLLIDVSGSMTSAISSKSELSRIDAANGLAILLREICESVVVYTFANDAKLVPARRGFALRDAIMRQFGGGTYTERAKLVADKEGYDRLIILTDEQSHQALSNPLTDKGYVINVAAYQNGVGYGKWKHVDGWSEAVVDFILATENED